MWHIQTPKCRTCRGDSTRVATRPVVPRSSAPTAITINMHPPRSKRAPRQVPRISSASKVSCDTFVQGLIEYERHVYADHLLNERTVDGALGDLVGYTATLEIVDNVAVLFSRSVSHRKVIRRSQVGSKLD